MTTGFNLQQRDRVWAVSKNGKPVAEVYLDYHDQVDEVVLYANTSAQVQLDILRLAASHVRQYVRHRSRVPFSGLVTAKSNDRSLSKSDSRRLMHFAAIPKEILTLDREMIVRELNLLRVDVVTVVHKTADEAIKAAVRNVGVGSLHCTLVPQRVAFDNEVVLRFTVKKPDRFIFWNNRSMPSGKGWDLHLIPPYHPVLSGWKSTDMVNGATDAYISHKSAHRTVRSISCPKAAQVDRHHGNFGTSWNHVKHPFCAIGRSVLLRLATTKVRSAGGVEELSNLLRASLGLDEKYVAISGGFLPPLARPPNRLNQIGRRSPWPKAAENQRMGNTVRGSESHCVWAYRVLREEGVLEQSHVPSWFIPEGWLEIYEGAEVRHGIS